VNALGAVVIERKSAPQDVLDAIPPGTAIGGWQFRLAPVLIVWFVDWRALEVQGDRLHELVDAGAAGVERDASHRYLDEKLIPFFKAAMANIKASGTTQLDCGQGIAQATLVAFEQGLGTCLLGIPLQKKLKRALELPDECDILVVQTVGYPAESPEAGGQRPRLPFEQRYYLSRYAETFPRDPEVVEGLERDKMLQKPAPLPWRWAELEYLARALGRPGSHESTRIPAGSGGGRGESRARAVEAAATRRLGADPISGCDAPGVHRLGRRLSSQVDLGQSGAQHAFRELLATSPLHLERLYEGRHRVAGGAGRRLSTNPPGRTRLQPAWLPEGRLLQRAHVRSHAPQVSAQARG
jgi:nitroreductase